jgi:hypothetical protein
VTAPSSIIRPDGLRWLSVSLLDGTILCELPSLASSDPHRRTIGRYESQTAKLTVTDKISPSWLPGTRPQATGLIAVRGAPGQEVIYWGGVILRRQRALGSNDVTLTLATPECYLDRRYTGAYTTDPSGTGATKDQNQVVADLVTNFVASSSGLPITVVTVGGAGTQRLAIYNDYDDKTVYSNIGALFGVLNGPEWTGHWQWNRAANTITPVLYVGNRIGAAVTPGLAPSVTFDLSNLIAGTLDENYSSGQGANVVTATSSGQGLARPQATSTAPGLNGLPRVEFRFQPATSIQDTLTLQGHSDRALTLLQNGTNTITLKASAVAGPMLGVDWNLGDDIGYEFVGPAFPGGFSGIGRCIGYEADDTYTSPVLYVPAII